MSPDQKAHTACPPCVAWLVGVSSSAPKGRRLIAGQGTYTGCRFNP